MILDVISNEASHKSHKNLIYVHKKRLSNM